MYQFRYFLIFLLSVATLSIKSTPHQPLSSEQMLAFNTQAHKWCELYGPQLNAQELQLLASTAYFSYKNAVLDSTIRLKLQLLVTGIAQLQTNTHEDNSDHTLQLKNLLALLVELQALDAAHLISNTAWKTFIDSIDAITENNSNSPFAQAFHEWQLNGRLLIEQYALEKSPELDASIADMENELNNHRKITTLSVAKYNELATNLTTNNNAKNRYPQVTRIDRSTYYTRLLEESCWQIIARAQSISLQEIMLETVTETIFLCYYQTLYEYMKINHFDAYMYIKYDNQNINKENQEPLPEPTSL